MVKNLENQPIFPDAEKFIKNLHHKTIMRLAKSIVDTHPNQLNSTFRAYQVEAKENSEFLLKKCNEIPFDNQTIQLAFET